MHTAAISAHHVQLAARDAVRSQSRYRLTAVSQAPLQQVSCRAGQHYGMAADVARRSPWVGYCSTWTRGTAA